MYASTVPGSSAEDFYAAGGMGIIYALDEQSGAIKWSFNTVKDGDLWEHPEVNSGGGAWYPPAVDTSTGTTYRGIGNPAPYPGNYFQCDVHPFMNGHLVVSPSSP